MLGGTWGRVLQTPPHAQRGRGKLGKTELGSWGAGGALPGHYLLPPGAVGETEVLLSPGSLRRVLGSSACQAGGVTEV